MPATDLDSSDQAVNRVRLDSGQRALAVGLVLSVTLVAFESTAVVTALPTITDELDGLPLYGATFAVYMLADLVALVWAGETADKRGVRFPFLIAIAFFIAGLIVASAAPTMEMVVLGRCLQGAGSGGFAPLAFITVRRAFPEARQATMFAYLSAGWVLPSLIAPAVSGVVTDRFGWRWVFLGIIPLAVTVAVLTARAMASLPAPPPNPNRRPSRLPLAGRAAAGVGAVAFALQSEHLWLLVPLAVGGGALASRPLRVLLPHGVFRARRGLPAIIAVRFIATATFLGVDSFVPLAADRLHGARPIIQGFIIAGSALSWTAGQAFAARRGKRLLPSRGAAYGFGLLMVGVATTAPILSPDWPLWATFASWCFGGLGMGILFNPTTVAAMSYAVDGREGEVSSQLHLADSLGFGIMSIVGGAIVAVADRTSFTLQGALATNFGLALTLGFVGLTIAHNVRPQSTS